GDDPLFATRVFNSQLGKCLNRRSLAGLERRERESAARRVTSDRRFLDCDRVGQVLFPDGALMAAIDEDGDDDQNHGGGNRAVFDEVLLVLLEKRDCLLDFEGELVSLELFTGNSRHGNLSVEIPW